MANFQHAGGDPKHANMSAVTPAAEAAVRPTETSSAPDTFASCIPSFAAACELMSAPYSCLVMSAHRRHVALPPVYLDKKRSGIREELEAELLKFSQSLQGVPVAYENIKIVGHHGNIYDDSGYIHMDIEANFIIFEPLKGQKLVGRVNKLGVGHVGCLVHGCFNASIPRPNLVSVPTWRDEGPRIGSEVEFEVTALDADTAGVLLIRGRLNSTRVQELLAMSEGSESGVPTNQPGSTEESPKKKRAILKVQGAVRSPALCEVDGSTTPQLNGTNIDENGNGTGEEEEEEEEKRKKKKKKKKKKQHLKEDEEEAKLSTMAVHCSDSSGYLSDKPSKKRSRETNSENFSSNAAPEPPKSKKKRKSVSK
ncbi:DNA-directed RNA polymerase I subunit RPA43 [Spinachia spinachia]